MKNHSPRFLSLVNNAKKRIHQLLAPELKAKLDSKEPLFLIDIREAQEWKSGCIPNAICLSKGLIERDIEQIIPNPAELIIVYCSGGFRSALTADNLQNMGYTYVYSLDAGLQYWIKLGYPLINPIIN